MAGAFGLFNLSWYLRRLNSSATLHIYDNGTYSCALCAGVAPQSCFTLGVPGCQGALIRWCLMNADDDILPTSPADNSRLDSNVYCFITTSHTKSDQPPPLTSSSNLNSKYIVYIFLTALIINLRTVWVITGIISVGKSYMISDTMMCLVLLMRSQTLPKVMSAMLLLLRFQDCSSHLGHPGTFKNATGCLHKSCFVPARCMKLELQSEGNRRSRIVRNRSWWYASAHVNYEKLFPNHYTLSALSNQSTISCDKSVSGSCVLSFKEWSNIFIE